LEVYWTDRLAHIHSDDVLTRFGLLAIPHNYAGLTALLSDGEQPRGVQTEIDALPAAPGLTLIEAPTGSGKTEAALAYAWRLIDAGVADSIVFALPTQATANAMLLRAEAFAERVYGNGNVVLAHGKRQFNEAFRKLAESGRRVTQQGKIEASVQCAAWLASSRKRVFLGQVGVCTVDQVLLSVLPVRHKFVRGFGLAKSVLIIDEVHAYDAYMHGLLGEVLRAQKGAGGSAILLSATLPAKTREQLLQTWDASGTEAASEAAPYPALWHISCGAAGDVVTPRTVDESQRPAPRVVETECLKLDLAFPDTDLLARIVQAAEAGAQVAIVLNLVDDAQRLARVLREQLGLKQAGIEVDLFHARYRFADRQEKERACLEHFGRNAPRKQGRILVATQVVEQSLDLDFDWMLTQICPVDLLFQRLGRLHRHQRESRPAGFESPRCTVLSVAGDDYGLHKLIYGNTRVLWRTEQLLMRASEIVFPGAYREWIEQVYQRDDWDDEPEKVAMDFDVYSSLQISRRKEAQRLTTMTVSSFRDDNEQITGLTRDGEMSLNVLPIQTDDRLLDGQRLTDLPEREQAEALNLNTVPVPASWNKLLHDCAFDKEGPLAGLWQLTMDAAALRNWSAVNGKFHYSHDFGLEKARNESA
jgi:CRISPR-associated endonuclease/helicase Cas3